jgi:hypothetical protein
MRHRIVSWRLLWLLPAALLFAGAGYQIVDQRATLARIGRSGLPRTRVPPTVFTEHSGMALAFICLGLVFVVLALRPRKSTDPEEDRHPDQL